MDFRPFSSPWLCGTHTSQFILCLPRSSFSQDSRARDRLYFTCCQRPCQVSNPVSCITVTLSTAHFGHSLVKLSALGQDNCCGMFPRTPGLHPQAATIPSLDLTTKNVSRYCKYLEDKITPLRFTVRDPPLCDSHCAEGSCDPMMPICEFRIDYASSFSFS